MCFFLVPGSECTLFKQHGKNDSLLISDSGPIHPFVSLTLPVISFRIPKRLTLWIESTSKFFPLVFCSMRCIWMNTQESFHHLGGLRLILCACHVNNISIFGIKTWVTDENLSSILRNTVSWQNKKSDPSQNCWFVIERHVCRPQNEVCGIKWLKPCFPPQSHFLQHLVFQSLNGLLLVQELWSVRVFRVNYFEHVRNPAVVSALVCLIWAHRNNQRAIVLGCGAKQLDLSGNKFVLPIVHIQIRPTPPKCCHFCNVCFCWTMSAFYKYEYAKLHGAPADKSCR